MLFPLAAAAGQPGVEHALALMRRERELCLMDCPSIDRLTACGSAD